MAKVKDFLYATALEVGSGVANNELMPQKGRQLIVSRFLQLGGLQDHLLRWRRASRLSPQPNDNWFRTGPAQTPASDIAQWKNIVVGFERRDLVTYQDWFNNSENVDGIEASLVQLAVAYRLGTVAMIGVDEQGIYHDPNTLHGSFLRPVNGNGNPDEDGDYMGVVMRDGGDFTGAIGKATADGRYFQSARTVVLAQIGDEVPQGLYRV